MKMEIKSKNPKAKTTGKNKTNPNSETKAEI